MSSHNHSFRRTDVRLNKRRTLRVVLLSLGFGTFGLATLGVSSTEWGPRVAADESIPAPKQTKLVLKPSTSSSAPLTMSARTSPIRFNPHLPLTSGMRTQAVRPVAGESTIQFATPESNVLSNGQTENNLQQEKAVERPGPVLLRPTANAFVLRPVMPPVLDSQSDSDSQSTESQSTESQPGLQSPSEADTNDSRAQFHFSDLSSHADNSSELTESTNDAPFSFSEPEGGAISFAFSDELPSQTGVSESGNIVVAAAPLMSLSENATLRADAAEDTLGAVKNNAFAENDPADKTADNESAVSDSTVVDVMQMSPTEVDSVSPDRIPTLRSRPNSFAIPTPPSDLDGEATISKHVSESKEELKLVPPPRIARPSKKLVIEVPQAPLASPVNSEQSQASTEEPQSIFDTTVNAHLSVEAGQTRDVNPNKSVRRVELQNREVCDAVLVGPHKLLLIGRMVGETRLAVWCDNEERPTLYQLSVATTQPTATGSSLDAVALRLTDTITATYPQCRVSVVAKGDSLAVTGQANSKQAAREIMRLVRSACLKTVHDELSVR